MQIISLDLPDVKLVRPKRLSDDRGWFSETYRKDILAAAGVIEDFVQDNQSFSKEVGTVRGLHFQIQPFAQAKIVSVLAGAIFDVAVDLRRASPTFLKHAAVRLDSGSLDQLYIPAGFAHGFCTLTPDTIVSYKVSARYSPECDRGIFWADPELGIDWPVDGERAVLSAKDARAPKVREAAVLFD